jgi:hypothetical protein
MNGLRSIQPIAGTLHAHLLTTLAERALVEQVFSAEHENTAQKCAELPKVSLQIFPKGIRFFR